MTKKLLPLIICLCGLVSIAPSPVRSPQLGNYVLTGGVDALSPADATSYYIGCCYALSTALHSVATQTQMNVPKAGTITRVTFMAVIGTNGSNESVSHFIRINDTTDTTLSTSETYDPGASTRKTFDYTGLSIPVTATDKVVFKITAPTWATNPTFAAATVLIYIE